MFNDNQIAELEAKLNAAHVKSRSQAGMTLSYIEGWHAIAEANRIFGFGEWDQEIISLECVWSGKRKIRSGEKDAAGYLARVRIVVTMEDGTQTAREDVGYGSGLGSDPGEAHEGASKEAVTDAMKRALRTFGNPFGLALYDKSRANVETPSGGSVARRGKRGGTSKAAPDKEGLRLYGYPSDKPHGDVIDYPRDANGVVKWINDMEHTLQHDPSAWEKNVNMIAIVLTGIDAMERKGDPRASDLRNRMKDMETLSGDAAFLKGQ